MFQDRGWNTVSPKEPVTRRGDIARGDFLSPVRRGRGEGSKTFGALSLVPPEPGRNKLTFVSGSKSLLQNEGIYPLILP